MGLSGMKENKKSVGVCIRRRRIYFRCTPQKRAIIGVLNERAVKKIGVEDGECWKSAKYVVILNIGME